MVEIGDRLAHGSEVALPAFEWKTWVVRSSCSATDLGVVSRETYWRRE
jgi:hypothetical protein